MLNGKSRVSITRLQRTRFLPVVYRERAYSFLVLCLIKSSLRKHLAWASNFSDPIENSASSTDNNEKGKYFEE